MEFLRQIARYTFFTGKGGVGKTALACATAISLADRGLRILLVSTDPASNLDEMLGTALSSSPRVVDGVENLSAMNIDPEKAAEGYRQRVIDPYVGRVPEQEIAELREQLSGACTVEIAAFDEFSELLAHDAASGEFDHIVFDTAPTGHTLRLLSLPRAWAGFLEDNERGASCLGPHSGLTMQYAQFESARVALADGNLTTIMLVTRPERSALAETARSARELRDLDLSNQRLIINGVFHATDRTDEVALAWEARAGAALAAMPDALRRIPTDEVPLRPFNMVGLDALRALLDPASPPPPRPVSTATTTELPLPPLRELVDELEVPGRGLIMVMGKGGVGKTTIAAAVAIELARRGHDVLLSTTDPAAHVNYAVSEPVQGLTVSRIDPVAETELYKAEIIEARSQRLDYQGLALLEEDLRSPCTEEVAVFRAFSRVVSQALRRFVVLDTAPTGHSLLLMDATGAYHRQVLRDYHGGAGHIVTPLMRLQDPTYTRVILVTLAETTPVSEAAGLQEDLRRAKIEPFAWVINNSLVATGTRDPVLGCRAALELEQIERVRAGLGRRLAIVPWQIREPVGPGALRQLLDGVPENTK